MFNLFLKNKSVIRTFTASIFLCGISFYIHSAPKVKPLAIEETVPINFGTIAGDNGICSMQSGGVLVGSSGQSCSGIQTPAEFRVGGTNGQVVDISVTGGTVQGITFRPLIDGPSIITMQGSSTSIFVIGELELNGASQGSISIPYIFSANYQ